MSSVNCLNMKSATSARELHVFPLSPVLVALANAFLFIAFMNPSLTLIFVIFVYFVDHPPDRCNRAGDNAV